MISFLFWNVMQRDVCGLLARAARERRLDVLMSAESQMCDQMIVRTLNDITGRKFIARSQEFERLRLFTGVDTGNWVQRQSDSSGRRIVTWSFSGSDSSEILLVVAHLASRIRVGKEGQASEVQELVTEIVRVEDSVGHQRTVIVGDLNMNPFDHGLIAAQTLNAVMTAQTAKGPNRIVNGREYRYFYNPMWGLFGDRTPGPAGTFYRFSPPSDDHYWHMLDQVLVRPDLIDALQNVEIVDRIDGVNLLSPKSLPRRNDYSDHLPLAFHLSFRENS